MPASPPRRPADACLLEALTTIASQAAAVILALRSPAIHWSSKSDDSPVSAADRAAQDTILRALHRFVPELPVISEEGELPREFAAARFVLVDPLDGTKEFIAGGDDFTVNIAIVENGAPVLGIVAAPALGLIWRGVVGAGAERLALAPGAPAERAQVTAICTRPQPAEGLTVALSRSHLDPATLAFLAPLPVRERMAAGSAVKLARVAEGRADLYPRLAPVCEWDLAAGHAVLAAAGGCIVTPEGGALTYGHAERAFRVPGFLAWGDPGRAALP